MAQMTLEEWIEFRKGVFGFHLFVASFIIFAGLVGMGVVNVGMRGRRGVFVMLMFLAFGAASYHGYNLYLMSTGQPPIFYY